MNERGFGVAVLPVWDNDARTPHFVVETFPELVIRLPQNGIGESYRFEATGEREANGRLVYRQVPPG